MAAWCIEATIASASAGDDGERAARRAIVDACHRLYARGLIAGPDGNVSVRLAPDRLLVTPSMLSKGTIGEDDLVVVREDGTLLEAATGRRASSELGMHLRVYARRADVHAVVHAHPPVATGFAVAGRTLPANVLPELILQMGDVPLVPYAAPGTAAVADGLEAYLGAHDAVLLAHHGATSWGATLEVALQRMESLEHASRILLTATLLGRVSTLAPVDVERLRESRARSSE